MSARLVTCIAFLAALGPPSVVRAEETAELSSGHGPSAPDRAFPSHRFRLAAHTPERVQLAFHYGLGQPLTAGGFNAAVDVRYRRFVFTYSHGQGLDVSSIALSEGLERVVAYSRILHDAGRVELERLGSRVVVFPGCRGLVNEFPRHIAEFSAASVLVLGRATTGKPMRATAVRFRHPAPPRLSEHLRVFGVTPTFDARETEVELEAAALDLAILDAQPGLVSYLDAYARDVIAKLPADDDLVSTVERAVASAMSRGVPDIEAIATQLGVGSRTLQRRLADAETGFQELVDTVRRSYAERYLADNRLAITEVAFLVGFSEPSNFHRAFRRWTGTIPAAYRARLTGA